MNNDDLIDVSHGSFVELLFCFVSHVLQRLLFVDNLPLL